MAFEDFVQLELPKRPFVNVDGAPGQLLVRSTNPLAARELTWVDAPNGTQVTYLADGPVSGHKLVRASAPGRVAYASADTPAHANDVLGITTGAALDGMPVKVQNSGLLVEPSWTWTVGAPVFAGVAGALTQVSPSSGFSLVVGIATAPDTVAVGIKQPFILS